MLGVGIHACGSGFIIFTHKYKQILSKWTATFQGLLILVRAELIMSL